MEPNRTVSTQTTRDYTALFLLETVKGVYAATATLHYCHLDPRKDRFWHGHGLTVASAMNDLADDYAIHGGY